MTAMRTAWNEYRRIWGNVKFDRSVFTLYLRQAWADIKLHTAWAHLDGVWKGYGKQYGTHDDVVFTGTSPHDIRQKAQCGMHACNLIQIWRV